MKLQTFPKTCGSNGIHVFVPLNGDQTYDDTMPFAKAVAETLESAFPGQGRSWAERSPVAPYSLLAGERPVVSMPLTWDEVESGPNEARAFEAEAALKRVDDRGDLFAPVLTLKQELPSFD
jgi:bifunctional non-homologous end joining protein LigD